MLLVDARWIGPHGIGRFAREVIARITGAKPLPAHLPLLHPLEAVWLSGVIAAIHPRVFYSPGFNPPLWSGVPLVFTIHDLNHLQFRENSGALKTLYYEYVVRPASQRAFAVLTVSEFSRQAILEWTGLEEARVINVGSGVELRFTVQGERFEPGYPYFLYVGNRKPHKNLRRLLEAYARSGVWHDIKLLLSGDPDTRIITEVRRFRLESQVAFAGQIPEERLPQYYRGAVALLFPSLYEGFGLPVIEAMACGTPVVASNVTAVPETAGDAALLVDPYDIDALAAAMRSIRDDAALCERLREKGLVRARRFSWEVTGAMVRKILSEAGWRPVGKRVC